MGVELLPHQQRVLDEKIELQAKIFLLNDFVDHSEKFTALGDNDQRLLLSQLHVMEQYKGILELRLSRWGVV